MSHQVAMPTARAPRPRPAERDLTSVEARYAYAHGEHELFLLIHGADGHHARDVSAGEAEFALVAEGPLILFGSRFGKTIPWSFAPYCWHMVPREAQAIPCLPGAPRERRAELAIVLTEQGGAGAERARACVILPLDFTRALHEAIREQAKLRFDPVEFQRALAELRRRCPTPGAVSAQARVRAVGCR